MLTLKIMLYAALAAYHEHQYMKALRHYDDCEGYPKIADEDAAKMTRAHYYIQWLNEQGIAF
jgi:hypothetical protein